MPLPGRFEGTHTLGIPHGEWQHVVWEFPYVYRDFVTGISLAIHAHRTPVPAPQGITAVSYTHLDVYKRQELHGGQAAAAAHFRGVAVCFQFEHCRKLLFAEWALSLIHI